MWSVFQKAAVRDDSILIRYGTLGHSGLKQAPISFRNSRLGRLRVLQSPGLQLVAVAGLLIFNGLRSSAQTTNTFNFTYATRAELLADGWDFLARNPNGTVRNTEKSLGTSPPDVAYAQTNADLGIVLRMPVGAGDLWMAANDTQNSLFRDLPPDWQSVRLQVSFAPEQIFQQLQLALYQDDDNYVEVGSGWTFGGNPAITFAKELGGVLKQWNAAEVSTTNLFLRLDRELTYGFVTALYSLDGTNWVTIDQTEQKLLYPRLAVWAGGSLDGFHQADLSQLQIIRSSTPVLTTMDFQRDGYVFSAIAGQACTNIQRTRVIYRGPAGLSWTLINTASWLAVSVTNGTADTAFDLSVSTTGLSAGVYETDLQFVSPGAANSPAALKVRLIVNPDARAKPAVWREGKAAALTVWVDDSDDVMFDVLQTNGYHGTYLLWGVDEVHVIPPFFTNYYNAGMELGSHTVHHPCNASLDEPSQRYEIETNIADIQAFTPATQQEIICFAFPCGLAGERQRAIAADYFLTARGYNVNRLEDASPIDWMFLKCFNSHEHDPADYDESAPPNPADLKTVVDAAIAQGKWANLVFHGYENDDGAVAYSVGKDIWVAPAGEVAKYIHQRDRTVISNYVETVGQISFDCFRFPLPSSVYRNFETVMTTNDLVTLQVDLGGIQAVTNVTIAGVATTNYSVHSVGDRTMLSFDTLVTTTPQHITLGLSSVTNHPPILTTNGNVTINEGQTLWVTNSATDPDTNALAFSLAAGAPMGMTITPDGLLNWTPGETAGGSNFTITVVVTDNGFPALSVSNSFVVTVNEINEVPVLPPQSDRVLIGQSLLTVVNTASDADLPVNPLGYRLMESPTNASISVNGVISWTPAAEQVPGTYTFVTVVTDTNSLAVNDQNLSATNQFSVFVSASPLVLPSQTNYTINEFSTLTVTNTASDPEIESPENVGSATTNLFYFTYANRNELLADGWSFVARSPDGSPRDTEQTVGALVSYDQAAHPGSLRVPVGIGDLWLDSNDTRNSLFRALPTNWISLSLHASFMPSQNYEQIHLAAYQDDDNYIQVGWGYNNTESASLISEVNGIPWSGAIAIGSVSNFYVRLDRDPVSNYFTGRCSADGSGWTTVDTRFQLLTNASLALWAGGSPGGFPLADFYSVEVVLTNAPKHLTYALVNPPAGAAIDANGVITWTPSEAQGPSTNVITTVVTDNGNPALFTTNSFTVTVNELNAPPVLTLPGDTNIAPELAWSVLATAVDTDVPTNAWGFSLVSGPPGLTVNPDGLISWTPDLSQFMTTNTVSIRVTDTNPHAVDFNSLSVTGSFQIVVSHVLTVTAASTNRFYGDANPTFSGTVVGLRPGDNITATYVTSANTGSPVGTYPIVPILSDPDGALTNYVLITNTGVLTVMGRPLTVTADAKSKVFGSPDPALTYQITSGLLVNGDALAGALARSPGENVGNYPISQGTLAATANYELSYVGANLAIVPSNAVVTLGNLNQVYDGTARSVSVTTEPAGLNVVVTYAGSASAPTNAGSYEVIGVVDELNYSGAVTNTLVVFTAAPVVLSVDLVEPADIIVSWNSVSNRTYRLQYKNDLNETEWVDLPPDIMATGPVTTVTNSVGSEPQRFFRLRTLP